MSAFRSGQSGRGMIGFIVALAVGIYVIIAAKAIYTVKHRGDIIDDYVYKVLGDAERGKWKEDAVRAEILKQAKEIGLVDLRASDIQVTREASRWVAHLEWESTYTFPGVSHKSKFVVDKTFARY